MHRLETRVPPPVVMLLLGAIAYCGARLLPMLVLPLPLSTCVGIAVIVAGLVLNILPKRSFRQAGTTVNPLKPESTAHLVTSGIYRRTRNPMYLGHTLILLGWALYLCNAAALLAAPAFVLYITRFQIRPEERQLAARFPEAYAAFCAQVPRWL